MEEDDHDLTQPLLDSQQGQSSKTTAPEEDGENSDEIHEASEIIPTQEIEGDQRVCNAHGSPSTEQLHADNGEDAKLPCCWSPVVYIWTIDGLSVKSRAGSNHFTEWITGEVPVPEDDDFFYFEVTINSCPQDPGQMFGIGFLDSNAFSRMSPEEEQPMKTYWYFLHNYITTGDVLGCLFDRAGRSVSYIRNFRNSDGELFEEIHEDVDVSKPLWPALCLKERYEVMTNFGASDYTFDFRKFLKGNRKSTATDMRWETGFPKEVDAVQHFDFTLSDQGLRAAIKFRQQIRADRPVPVDCSYYNFAVTLDQCESDGAELDIGFYDPCGDKKVYCKCRLQTGDRVESYLNRNEQYAVTLHNGEVKQATHFDGDVSTEQALFPYIQYGNPTSTRLEVVADFSQKAFSENLPGCCPNDVKIKAFPAENLQISLPSCDTKYKSPAALYPFELQFPTDLDVAYFGKPLLSPNGDFFAIETVSNAREHHIYICDIAAEELIFGIPVDPHYLLPEGCGIRAGDWLDVLDINWMGESDSSALLLLVAKRDGLSTNKRIWAVLWDTEREEGEEVVWAEQVAPAAGYSESMGVDITLSNQYICAVVKPDIISCSLLVSYASMTDLSPFRMIYEVPLVLFARREAQPQVSPDQSMIFWSDSIHFLSEQRDPLSCGHFAAGCVAHVEWSEDSTKFAMYADSELGPGESLTPFSLVDFAKARNTGVVEPIKIETLGQEGTIDDITFLERGDLPLRLAVTLKKEGKGASGLIVDASTGDLLSSVHLGDVKLFDRKSPWWITEKDGSFTLYDKFTGMELAQHPVSEGQTHTWAESFFCELGKENRKHEGSTVVWTVGDVFCKAKVPNQITMMPYILNQRFMNAWVCRVSSDGSTFGVADWDPADPDDHFSRLTIWDLQDLKKFSVPILGSDGEVGFVDGDLKHKMTNSDRKDNSVVFAFSYDGKRVVVWALGHVILWEIGEEGLVPLGFEKDFASRIDGLCFVEFDAQEFVAAVGSNGVMRLDLSRKEGRIQCTHPNGNVRFSRITHGGQRALLFMDAKKEDDGGPSEITAQCSQSSGIGGGLSEMIVEIWDLSSISHLKKATLGCLLDGLTLNRSLPDLFDPELLLEIAAGDGNAENVALWPIGCKSACVYKTDPRKEPKKMDIICHHGTGVLTDELDMSVYREKYESVIRQFCNTCTKDRCLLTLEMFAASRDGTRIAAIRKNFMGDNFFISMPLKGMLTAFTWYDDLVDMENESMREFLSVQINRYGPGLINQPAFPNGRSLLHEAVFRGHNRIVEQIIILAFEKEMPVIAAPWWSIYGDSKTHPTILQPALENENTREFLSREMNRYVPDRMNQPTFSGEGAIQQQAVLEGYNRSAEHVMARAAEMERPVIAIPWGSVGAESRTCPTILQLAVDQGLPEVAKTLIRYMLSAGQHDCTFELSEKGRVFSGIFSEFLAKQSPAADFRSVFLDMVRSKDFCCNLGTVLIPNNILPEDKYLVGMHRQCKILPQRRDGLLTLIKEAHKTLGGYGDENFRNAAKVEARALVVPVANFATLGSECILKCLQKVTPNSNVFEYLPVAALVKLKWNLYGKMHVLRKGLFYICLLTAFTGYSGMLGSLRSLGGFDIPVITLLLVSVGLALMHLIEEAAQAYKHVFIMRDSAQPGKWMEKLPPAARGLVQYLFFSRWNALELASYILVAVIIPIMHFSGMRYLFAVVGVTNIVLWWKVLYFMQIFERTAPLVITIFKIMNDILAFALLVLIVLFGFGLAFFVLVGFDQYIDESEVNTRFGTIPRSLFSVFAMLLGQFDPFFFEDELVTNEFVALVLFVAFAISMIVILLNLLIAIMSDSYNRIREVQRSSFIEAKAQMIQDAESSLFFKSPCFEQHIHILILEEEWRKLYGGDVDLAGMPKQLQEQSRAMEAMNTRLQAVESKVASKLQDVRTALQDVCTLLEGLGLGGSQSHA